MKKINGQRFTYLHKKMIQFRSMRKQLQDKSKARHPFPFINGIANINREKTNYGIRFSALAHVNGLVGTNREAVYYC